MKALFGTVTGFDPQIQEQAETLDQLSLRERKDRLFIFFSKTNRLITLAHASLERAPDRILVNSLPNEATSFERNGWSLQQAQLTYKGKAILSLENAPAAPSDILPAINDFPGHVRTTLSRTFKTSDRPLKQKLDTLASAIKEPLTEAVEMPLLEVIGYREGDIHAGDAALVGMLLTAKAFLKGKRIRADWHSRLSMELRRFLHRTSKYSSALLRYAIEGRTFAVQERFFNAMARDYETLADSSIHEMMASPEFSGEFFLLGCFTALEIIRSDTAHADSQFMSVKSGKSLRSPR